MPIDEQDILQLCNHGESNHLDYKREQYKFVNYSDHEKSELLKDVLALANANRSETAFILIGVDEVNHRGVISGMQPEAVIDDAALQQFINAKLNRNISFLSYKVVCTNETVQVIEIPECLDSRPYYATKDFGKLKKEVVKLKIGSSTGDATPDEIAEMGRSSVSRRRNPELEISITSPSKLQDGKFYAFEPIFNIPNDQIEAESKFAICGDKFVGTHKKCEWLKKAFTTLRIGVNVKNISLAQADDMKAEMKIVSSDPKALEPISGFPVKNNFMYINQITMSSSLRKPYNLSPGESYEDATEGYFTVKMSGTVILQVRVLARDMAPLVKSFELEILFDQQKCHSKEFVDMAYQQDEEQIFRCVKGIYSSYHGVNE